MESGEDAPAKRKPYSYLVSPEMERWKKEFGFYQKKNLNILSPKSELALAFEKRDQMKRKKQEELEKQELLDSCFGVLKNKPRASKGAAEGADVAADLSSCSLLR